MNTIEFFVSISYILLKINNIGKSSSVICEETINGIKICTVINVTDYMLFSMPPEVFGRCIE